MLNKFSKAFVGGLHWLGIEIQVLSSPSHRSYFACQSYIHAICMAVCENHICTIMHKKSISLYTEKSKWNDALTILWTELKDLHIKMLFHQQRKIDLEHRLDDSNESLGGPGISRIVGGHNTKQQLLKFILIMSLKRSKIQVQVETEQLMIDDYTNRYNAIHEEHKKLCDKVNGIRKKIRRLENKINNDSAKNWDDIYKAEES